MRSALVALRKTPWRLKRFYSSIAERKWNVGVYSSSLTYDGQGPKFTNLIYCYRHLSAVAKLFDLDKFSSSASSFPDCWNESFQHCEKLRTRILSLPPCSDTVALFDDLSNMICQVADAANFLAVNHQCHEVCTAAAAIHTDAVQYVETLNTDHELYAALVAAESLENLDGDTKYVAGLFLKEFKLAGLGKKREIVLEKTSSEMLSGQSFVSATVDPVVIPFARCPTPLLSLADRQGRVTITEDSINSRFDDLREAAWKIFYKFDLNRETHLKSLLDARQELALATDCTNYATRSLYGTMAGSPKVVLEFLNKLSSQLKPLVSAEMEHFNTLKRSREAIQLWDLAYYSIECRSKVLQSYPAFSSKHHISSVLQGLAKLTKIMLRLQLIKGTVKRGEVWSDDVIKYSVQDESNQVLGIIYFDLYSRTGKKANACMHTIQCGTFTQTPIVVLLCNQPANAELGLQDIKQLLHEYGHALHAVLGRTRYQHVSGTRCPTDFAEIPSTLLESLVSSHSILLDLMSVKEDFISEDTVAILESDSNDSVSSNCYEAIATQLQLYYALLDISLHSEHNVDPQAMAYDVAEQCLGVELASGIHAWHQRFSHLYFYGGNYYSYLWSKAIVNLVIEKHSLCKRLKFTPDIRLFLEQGGSIDFTEQVEHLIGEPLNLDIMVDALIQPLAHANASCIDSKL